MTERSELVFICSLMTNFSEEYLGSLPDEELNSIYDAEMEKGMNAVQVLAVADEMLDVLD